MKKGACLTSPENRKSPLPEFILAGVKSLKSDLLDSPVFTCANGIARKVRTCPFGAEIRAMASGPFIRSLSSHGSRMTIRPPELYALFETGNSIYVPTAGEETERPSHRSAPAKHSARFRFGPYRRQGPY